MLWPCIQFNISVVCEKDGTRLESSSHEFKLKGRLEDPIRVMPDELGPLPAGVDPFERCNLWLLYTTLAWGVEKVCFVCLWNGGGGDGRFGTEHMYNEVKKANGPGDLD